MARTTRRQATLPGMGEEIEAPPSVAPASAEPARPPRSLASPTGPTPPHDLTGQTVYVIDANSLIYQVFHAIPEMTSPRGEPVNAVFGFTRDLLFLLEKKKPDYLFCSFDMSGPTFRHELYADYKVHRAEMPAELSPQFPAIRRMIDALGIPILELEAYEADDVLATVARLTDEARGECVLVTGDKDCRQLITDRVKVYNVRKDQMYDAAALEADWGIRPDQVVDFQAIVGDSVDNVPGIPLIGPKIARELLTAYDTLEGIYVHAAEIKGEKRRENIVNSQQQAMLSRDLVRLDTNVPIAIDWGAARTTAVNTERVLALCAECGFHRFAEQVRSWQSAPSEPAWQKNYVTIESLEQLELIVQRQRSEPQVAIRVEPTCQTIMQAEIAGVALSSRTGEAYYAPLVAPLGEKAIDRAKTLAALRSLLESAEVNKVSRDLKQDTVLLSLAGISAQRMAFDTMLASYLLDAGERNHSLGELAQRYLGHATIKLGQVTGTGSKTKTLDQVSVAAVSPLVCEEVDVALRLQPILLAKLRDEELLELYETVEIPLVEVLADMERLGVQIDTDRLAELSAEYGQRVAELEKEIYALAEHEFNIASPKQLQQVLFVEQKLPVLRRTKSGPSTDASVLEELAVRHALPAKIIAFRQFSKLKNTYVNALPTLVNPRTGRVHATFQQAVAATGRLSSTDPNLQNIPIRTREGREIRSAFVAGDAEWSLLSADYSQIELRVLAHFSRDEALCAAFARDEDIHTQVASQVFGVPLADVTSEMRRRAKAVNFGVLYGQSPFGLAKSLNISQDEAAAFIDAYFDRYPGVEKFLNEILEGCRKNGYVKTILGRKRSIRGVRPGVSRQRNLPERTAINTVIQGSAADLIKLAMLAIHRTLRERKFSARMVLQIHDELLFEAPRDELETLAESVRRAMSGVMSLSVPLKVDVKTGRNWAETQPWSGATDDANELPWTWDEVSPSDE